MKQPKIVVAAQYYEPDDSTTSALTTQIAKSAAMLARVEVLSGSAPHPALHDQPGVPVVFAVSNVTSSKGALRKRLFYETLFAIRMFWKVLVHARKGDVVLTVTAPFMLPYAAVAAAWMKGASSMLLLFDLYPDVLIVTGMLRRESLLAKFMHSANSLMFHALDAVVIIGRDTRRLLQRYKGAHDDKLHFIPNWASLRIEKRSFQGNRFRADGDTFVVGLSGNLGFTHDPVVVFEAARELEHDRSIQFLLSGWGTGFETLKAMQARNRLPNVRILERVAESELEDLLAAADAWLIPYRANVAGVSVPSRFYNLLAVGRPILLISESDSEAAITITEHDLGWVTAPGDAAALARTIRHAAAGDAAAKGDRAVQIADQYGREAALEKYRHLLSRLLKRSQDGG